MQLFLGILEKLALVLYPASLMLFYWCNTFVCMAKTIMPLCWRWKKKQTKNRHLYLNNLYRKHWAHDKDFHQPHQLYYITRQKEIYWHPPHLSETFSRPMQTYIQIRFVNRYFLAGDPIFDTVQYAHVYID